MTDTTTSTHPAVAAGCTPEQVAAFEKICDGLDRYVSAEMARELARKGLVVREVDINTWTTLHHVPLYHLTTWAAWCQETGRNTEG